MEFKDFKYTEITFYNSDKLWILLYDNKSKVISLHETENGVIANSEMIYQNYPEYNELYKLCDKHRELKLVL